MVNLGRSSEICFLQVSRIEDFVWGTTFPEICCLHDGSILFRPKFDQTENGGNFSEGIFKHQHRRYSLDVYEPPKSDQTENGCDFSQASLSTDIVFNSVGAYLLRDCRIYQSSDYVQRFGTLGGLPPTNSTTAKAGDSFYSRFSAFYAFYLPIDLSPQLATRVPRCGDERFYGLQYGYNYPGSF